LDVPKDQLRSLRAVAAALTPLLAPQAAAVRDTNGTVPVSVRVEEWAGETPAYANGHGANGSVLARGPAATTYVSHESEAAALYGADRPISKPFKGKVLFVSGSGRGLGKDISTYLADLGASVVINSFHSRPQGEATAQEIRDRGGDAIHVWGSMANPEHVEQV